MKKNQDTTTSFLEDAPSKTGGKKPAASKEAAYTVVKRNGTLVPFRRDRILRAIEAAFRDTKKAAISTPLDAELEQKIQHITDLVVKQVLHLPAKGASLTD